MTWLGLDQDQSQDDEVCGVQLGVDLLRNINDSLNDRHSGASKHWTAQAAYSTPSNVWRSIPFIVPIYEGATTLNVALRYEAALGSESAGTACIDVRLACNGRVGSTTTLNVTSAVSLTTLSVDVRASRRWAYAAIQVRSQRAESSSLTFRVDEQVSGGVVEGEKTGTISTGRTHYEYVPDTDEGIAPDAYMGGPYHVTRVIDIGGSAYWLQHWPHVPAESTLEQVEGSVNDTGTLYDLGTITPHGMAWWWESSGLSFVDDDTWLATHGPLQVVRPTALQQLDSWARTILKRPKVWAMGPRGDDGATAADNGGGRVGYTATGTSDALRIVRAVGSYDDETLGLRFAAVLGSVGDLSSSVTLTATFRDDTGTSLGTESWTQRVGPTTGIAPVRPMTQDGQSQASYALYAFFARDPYEHGSGDLMGQEEYRPGTVPGDVSSAASFATRDLRWPSGITDGDAVYVDITTDATVHAFAATVTEWR